MNPTKSNTRLQNIKKICALCESELDDNSKLSICRKCLGYADCCIGLEKVTD